MNGIKATCIAIVSLFFCSVGLSQNKKEFTDLPLNNLNAFREAGNNWIIASDAVADYTKEHDLRPVKGEGVLINTFSRNSQMNLFTKEEFGDIQLELDFMMAKNSNSGVYLHGRYEVQLLDSWTRLNPTSSDAGGIYMRWTRDKGTFEGTAPVMNVARAPGLWQHLSVMFRAPRFNEKGEKTSNARFESVYLNGVLVQQQTDVTGPTGSGMLRDEKNTGPIAIQGDHGPVAFRNIRYRPLPPPSADPKGDQYWIPNSPYWESIDPIIVTPAGKPSFIKTFLMYGDKKLTHVLSVGNPNQINYSYDVKQGALFQIWRGQFLDLAMSWRDRGGMQLAKPLGSVIRLSDAPFLATLADEKAIWPDSAGFDEFNNKGYVLDKQRSPTFSYSVNGFDATDSIYTQSNGEGIVRTVTVSNAPNNLYGRIAVASDIVNVSGDLYAADKKSYYIRIDKKFKPVVRQSKDGWEMIVKYDSANPLTYSIIW